MNFFVQCHNNQAFDQYCINLTKNYDIFINYVLRNDKSIKTIVAEEIVLCYIKEYTLLSQFTNSPLNIKYYVIVCRLILNCVLKVALFIVLMNYKSIV